MNYAIMLLAGVGVPVLAALNGALGRYTGSPAASAAVTFVVAFACAIAVGLITGPQGFAKLPSAPKHLFLAGLFAAFYILSITWIGPIIGIGNAVFLVLLGQMISASVIDHFGLFGAPITSFSATRFAGLCAMVAGLALIQRG